MISSKNLAKAIYEISIKHKQNDAMVLEAIMSYVEKYKLHSLLPKVIIYLEDKVNKNTKWNTLEVETGLEIENYLIEKIKQELKAEKAEKTTRNINKKLIGGFVASYRGFIYDASMYNQLQLLKKSLTK
jgi:F0F1-type ATP synthase delta subunit